MSSPASVFRPNLFAGRAIVVSGGGTGIGRAIARELAGLGATVILCSRSLAHLEPAQAEITGVGGAAIALVCNIREAESVDAFWRGAVDRVGVIHGLVNNAGGQFISPAEAITSNGWRAVIDTNLTGTFNMSRAAYVSGMRERGGAIVNIVADMWRGFPNMAHTGAARAGVVNLTQTLALEWALSGVRVNAVAPGLINATGLQTYPDVVRARLASIAQETPAQRMGTEAEVAAAVTFLLSPAAAYISGATLRVDGAGSLYRLQGYSIPEHAPWPSYGVDEREE
ncbi:MAG TPA: SDR family oxidoreductase [Ktedonobacterales bacterium]